MEKERQGSAASFAAGLSGAGLLVALLVADIQSDADLNDEYWFMALLALAVVAVIGGIGSGVAGWFSTYVQPLRRIPTALERRERRNAQIAKDEARKKRLEVLRDHLIGHEERASAELEEDRFTNRLAGFSHWVRTNRKGINRDEQLHALLETWDHMLVCAVAHWDAEQAAWHRTDSQSIPALGDANRKHVLDLLAAIVAARHAVEGLLQRWQ